MLKALPDPADDVVVGTRHVLAEQNDLLDLVQDITHVDLKVISVLHRALQQEQTRVGNHAVEIMDPSDEGILQVGILPDQVYD